MNDFFSRFGLSNSSCISIIDTLRDKSVKCKNGLISHKELFSLIEKYLELLESEEMKSSRHYYFAKAHCLYQKGSHTKYLGTVNNNTYVRLFKRAIQVYKKGIQFFRDDPNPNSDVNLSFRRDFVMVHYEISETFNQNKQHKEQIDFSRNALKDIYQYSVRFVELELTMVEHLDESLRDFKYLSRKEVNESCIERVKNLLVCMIRLNNSVPTRFHNDLYIRVEKSCLISLILQYMFQINDTKNLFQLFPYYLNLTENLQIEVNTDQSKETFIKLYDGLNKKFGFWESSRKYNLKNDSGWVCFVCRKVTRRKCGRCLIGRYCCSEHQKSDWKNHKKYCVDWRDILSYLEN